MINNFRILTYIRAFTGYSMSIGLGRSSTGGDPVQDNVLWVQTREGDFTTALWGSCNGEMEIGMFHF